MKAVLPLAERLATASWIINKTGLSNVGVIAEKYYDIKTEDVDLYIDIFCTDTDILILNIERNGCMTEDWYEASGHTGHG